MSTNPKKIRLYVGKEDIEQGRQGSAKYCAIARALIRKGYEGVLVSSYIATGVKDQRYCSFELPERAQEFIKNFDNDTGSVKPTSFTLKVIA